MNLTTTYLGLKLKNPLMPGASPMADNLDTVRRLEDAGASAIVLHSLFAEQLERNESIFTRHLTRWQDSFAEASIWPAGNEAWLAKPPCSMPTEKWFTEVPLRPQLTLPLRLQS